MDLRCPLREKRGKLADHEINLLVEWVRRGALDPRTAAAKIGRNGCRRSAAVVGVSADSAPVAAPAVTEAGWPRTEIDRFILVELEHRGLPHAASAEKRVLLRRATYDLAGLPPTADEIHEFLADQSPQAFEKVVDRLLDSPAYGERWARHWLDVVRYADYYQSNPRAHGSNEKFELHEAYRYRDWVVQSLQKDMPFDQFVTYQVAGDRLPSPRGEAVYPDGLIASGFLSLGSWDHGDTDKNKTISDIADDQIDVIGKAFLGLTLSCARCHEHKFDPITQEDYYGLAGIFYSTRTLEHVGGEGDHTVLHRVALVPDAQIRKRDTQMQQLHEIQLQLESLSAVPAVAGDNSIHRTR